MTEKTNTRRRNLVEKIQDALKYIWEIIRPSHHTIIVERFKESQEILTDLKNIVKKEKDMLEKELQFYKSLTNTIMDESPDMVWLKSIDGKYIVANKAIKEGLLFDCNPEGKTDIELAKKAKEKFGDECHTFGEVCGNSDLVVLECLEPRRFLEYGKVSGKDMYLEVYKFPFYLDGVLTGVAGIGRDLTEYVEAYRNSACSSCSARSDIFEKYEFKE